MNATTIGIDLAKNCFQIAVADERYRVQRRERLTRKRFVEFMANHHIPRQTSVELNELATHYNPTLRGWLNYYGHFYRSALRRIFFHFDGRLLQWARRKYRNLRCNVRRRRRWRERTLRCNPRLFTHWLAFEEIKVRTMGAV